MATSLLSEPRWSTVTPAKNGATAPSPLTGQQNGKQQQSALFDSSTGRPRRPPDDDFLSRLEKVENGIGASGLATPDAPPVPPAAPALATPLLSAKSPKSDNDGDSSKSSERKQTAKVKKRGEQASGSARGTGSSSAVAAAVPVSNRRKKSVSSKEGGTARAAAKGKATKESSVAAVKEEEEEEDSDVEGSSIAKKKGKKEVPRHRRIYKSAIGGEKLGLTFCDHPSKPGVLISSLTEGGAAMANGCMVGDHIVKINGAKPDGHRNAMEMTDAAWSEEAADPSKDRLKFSLGDRTKRVVLGQPGQVPVRVVGASSSSVAPPEEDQLGITLINHKLGGVGVVVTQVQPGLAASTFGLDVGTVIYSVGNTLVTDHSHALQEMKDEFYKHGQVALLVSTKRLTAEEIKKQSVEQITISIIHS